VAENLDILDTAGSLLVRAALRAARFPGRVRQRYLKRLAAKDIDAKANLSRGRIRIASQLRSLGIFLAASTVRNILQRPELRKTPAFAAPAAKPQEKTESRSIPASHPNHVGSTDTTKALCSGVWPIQVLTAIDHSSRKVACVAPLEGPNTGWIVEALEQAMREHGAPKHLISDQAPVFAGDAFATLPQQWNIKPRFGAVGKSGAIAVTERVIKTFKYEWRRRVPLIKGFDHLTSLRNEFEHWYHAPSAHEKALRISVPPLEPNGNRCRKRKVPSPSICARMPWPPTES
jgi:hypothetical protein